MKAAIRVDHPRSSWGALPFPRRHARVSHDHLEVHHDVYPVRWSPDRHAREIEKLHMAKGWNGPFYNFGLDPEGSLWELRGLTNVSQGSALTVVAFGDYHTGAWLTDAQLERLWAIAATFPDKPVDWHRRRAAGTKYASLCPGDRAIAQLMAGPPRRRPTPPTTPQEAHAMGMIHAQLIAGVRTAEPGGRWPFVAVDAAGRVLIGNDVSGLDGSSDWHFGDASGFKLAAPIVGLHQLVDKAGEMTGYVLMAEDQGTFTFGTGAPSMTLGP